MKSIILYITETLKEAPSKVKIGKLFACLCNKSLEDINFKKTLTKVAWDDYSPIQNTYKTIDNLYDFIKRNANTEVGIVAEKDRYDNVWWMTIERVFPCEIRIEENPTTQRFIKKVNEW